MSWKEAPKRSVCPSVFLTSVICISLLFGCGKAHHSNRDANLTSAPKTAEPKPGSTAREDNQEYVKTTSNSRFGVVDTYSLTEAALNEKTNKALRAQLRPISGIEKFNLKAFQFLGLDKEGLVVIAPRVHLRASFFGEKIIPRDLGDGSVSLDVSVALASGLESNVMSEFGDQGIPKHFLIENKSSVLESLEQSLNIAPSFLSEIRCPSSLQIHSKQLGRFSVGFRSPLKSCPIDILFPAQVVFNRQDWDKLMSDFLEGSIPEVDGQFDLSVPVPVSFSKFNLRKDVLSELIKSKLAKISSREGEYSASQIKGVLDEIIDEIQSSFGTKFDSSNFVVFKEKLYREYFTRKSQPSCKENQQICFFQQIDNSNKEPSYQFDVTQTEYFGEPLKIDTTSELRELLSSSYPFWLKSKNRSLVIPPSEGEKNNLFQSVWEGEVFELRFETLRINEATWSQPKEEYVKNEVCISRGPAPFHEEVDSSNCLSWNQTCGAYESGCDEWDSKCTEWEALGTRSVSRGEEICKKFRSSSSSNWPSGYRISNVKCIKSERYCSKPTRRCTRWDNTSCKEYGKKRVEDGPGPCLATENQWQNTTIFSSPSASENWTTRKFAPSDWDLIVSKLTLNFTFANETKPEVVNCKIQDLEHRRVGDNRLLLVLRNSKNCQIFKEEFQKSGTSPTISILNDLSIPNSKYKCGRLWEDYKGNRKYSCPTTDGKIVSQDSTKSKDDITQARHEPVGIYQDYYPRVEVLGSSRSIGTFLENRGVENAK